MTESGLQTRSNADFFNTIGNKADVRTWPASHMLPE
jgi:hypothetical protein